MQRYSISTAVTPSDTVDIWPGTLADAIFVGVTGNLTLVLADGSELPITAAAPNTIWPFATKRVKAGATATGIRGLKY